jgi:hypothetical protein
MIGSDYSAPSASRCKPSVRHPPSSMCKFGVDHPPSSMCKSVQHPTREPHRSHYAPRTGRFLFDLLSAAVLIWSPGKSVSSLKSYVTSNIQTPPNSSLSSEYVVFTLCTRGVVLVQLEVSLSHSSGSTGPLYFERGRTVRISPPPPLVQTDNRVDPGSIHHYEGTYRMPYSKYITATVTRKSVAKRRHVSVSYPN